MPDDAAARQRGCVRRLCDDPDGFACSELWSCARCVDGWIGLYPEAAAAAPDSTGCVPDPPTAGTGGTSGAGGTSPLGGAGGRAMGGAAGFAASAGSPLSEPRGVCVDDGR